MSWDQPPVESRNGIVKGFTLFFKQKGSNDAPNTLQVEKTLITVTRLSASTEYEFQVLAFTSIGDGAKSSVVVAKTKEDGKKHC